MRKTKKQNRVAAANVRGRLSARVAHDDKNRYRLLADNMADMVAVFDRNGNLKYISPSAARVLGYSKEEISRVALGDLLTPASLETVLQMFRDRQARIAANRQLGIATTSELELRRKDGTTLIAEIVTSTLHDAEDQGTDVLAIARDITERKRAQNAEYEQRTLAEALRDTASALADTLDLDEVFDRIMELAGRVVKNDGMTIFLIEGETARAVRYRFDYSPAGEMPTTIVQEIEKFPTLQTLYTTHQPVYIADTQTDAQWIVYPGFEWIRSYAGIPVIDRGEIIGLMDVVSQRPGAFSAHEIECLRIFASQAAIAMRNANLYKSASRQAAEMTTINRIGAALASGLEMQKVLTTLYDECHNLLKVDSFYVALYDKLNGDITFPLFIEGGTPIRMATQNIHVRAGLTSEIINTGKTFHIPDTTKRAEEKKHAIIRVGGKPSRAYIGVPLRQQDEVIGALSIQSYEPNVYSPDDLRLIEIIANQASIAIQNARLFTETSRHADQMSSLYRFALTITEGLEMPRVLQTLYDQCRQIAKADIFYIGLYDQKTGVLSVPLFLEAEHIVEMKPRNLNTTGGMAGYVIESRQTLHIPDALDPALSKDLPIMRVGGIPSRTYLGIPLIVRDEVIGLISIQSYQPNVYLPEHVQLFETIAVQAAVAIDNARLFSEAQRLAIIDPLTQAYNRRHFFEVAEKEVTRSRRYNCSLALIALDADDFKLINDTYGHMVGDQTLLALVRCCEQALRQTDTLGRFGGEEFFILLPETDHEHALAAAERLRQSIEKISLEADGRAFSISVSMGVASLTTDDANMDGLVKRADDALYRAKAQGKNRVMG
jgi:diguanylate cyclase (GGDEF)-like protein/PAS domain S-box-containing protein